MMRQNIQIGKRTIGNGHSVFIIAEAGVNHNGNGQLAMELIRATKSSGADCVEFQTFKAEKVATRMAPKADYQKKVTDPKELQYDMLQKLELPGLMFMLHQNAE